jgi:BASS family bile acid:Na+ symporter
MLPEAGVSALLQAVIAAVVFLVATAVGTGITVADLRRVAARLRAVVAATLAQWLLLPGLAVLLGAVLPLPEPVALALLLAAACPGGAFGATSAFLAGADTALAATLTAISTAATAATLPALLATALVAAGRAQVAVAGPWRHVLAALVGAVLIPLVTGAALRRRWPEAVARHQPALRRAAWLGVVTVVAMIVADQWAPLGRFALAAFVAGLLLAVGGGALGYAVGTATGLPAAGRFAVGVEHVSRNQGIFLLVAGPLLGRPDLAAVGVVFFLVQAAICLGAASTWRRWVR